MKNTLAVSYSSPETQADAEQFAEHHQLSCTNFEQADSELLLNFTTDFVELRDTHQNTAIHVDFISGSLAHRKRYGGGRGQAIAKAIGLKQGTPPPRVIDATAGLGKDAFVLACLGCPVTLLERSPVVAQLVSDAMLRANEDRDFSVMCDRGFQLINANAADYLSQLDDDQRPEIVYLDPMYPERKKSALVKKNMQILQKLLGQDSDTESLLEAALRCAKKRVVVKRPKGAALIADKKASMAFESKNTRYDVYLVT